MGEAGNILPADRPVRIAVVGIGGAAQVIHLPLIEETEELELVGLGDTEAYKLGRLSDKYDVPGFLDIQNLLKNTNPDVVLVSTPPISHLPLALSALQYGSHVILEKPACRNYEETIRLAEAAEKYGRQVLVAMNLRFRQDVNIFRNFLQAEELGSIWRVRAGWLKKRTSWARSPWLDQPKISGGGVLMDLGLQMIDVVHWLLDAPKVNRVVGFAHFRDNAPEVEEIVTASIEYENNLTFHLDCSWSLMRERSVAYTYFEGKEGSAQLNPLMVNKWMQGELVNVSPAKTASSGELYQASFDAELRYFIGILRGLNLPVSTIGEAVETMKIVDLVYRSIRRRREIRPDDDQ